MNRQQYRQQVRAVDRMYAKLSTPAQNLVNAHVKLHESLVGRGRVGKWFQHYRLFRREGMPRWRAHKLARAWSKLG